MSGNSITIDSHVFTDRGDGLYIPDKEYYVKNELWCVGQDYGGKKFVIVSQQGSRAVRVVAVVCSSDKIRVAQEYKDTLRAEGLDAGVIFGEFSLSSIGGIVNAV